MTKNAQHGVPSINSCQGASRFTSRKLVARETGAPPGALSPANALAGRHPAKASRAS